MDDLRTHIKQRSNIFVKALLGKKALRGFISDEMDNIYRILITQNNLSYAG